MSNTKLNIDIQTYRAPLYRTKDSNNMKSETARKSIELIKVAAKVVLGLRFASPAPKLRLAGKLANAR